MSEDSKLQPSSDSCSISVINVFKKGQKLLQMQLSENMWDKLSCWPPQGHWRRRRRKSRCWRDSPAACGEEHGEVGSPWSSRVEGYPPAAPWPPHTGAAGWPKEVVTLWEACPEAGFWQDMWIHGERIPHWSRCQDLWPCRASCS